MIHIYCGEGKGKTTAAVGLLLRAAGAGIPALAAQFLKDGSSGEICLLKKLPGVKVWHSEICCGFVRDMTEEQKKEMKEIYTGFLQQIRDEIRKEKGQKKAPGRPRRMILLDEVLYACKMELLEEELLCGLMKDCPEDVELILTGRDPSEALLSRADYVSEIVKRKHPFDRGILARKGIEL